MKKIIIWIPFIIISLLYAPGRPGEIPLKRGEPVEIVEGEFLTPKEVEVKEGLKERQKKIMQLRTEMRKLGEQEKKQELETKRLELQKAEEQFYNLADAAIQWGLKVPELERVPEKAEPAQQPKMKFEPPRISSEQQKLIEGRAIRELLDREYVKSLFDNIRENKDITDQIEAIKSKLDSQEITQEQYQTIINRALQRTTQLLGAESRPENTENIKLLIANIKLLLNEEAKPNKTVLWQVFIGTHMTLPPRGVIYVGHDVARFLLEKADQEVINSILSTILKTDYKSPYTAIVTVEGKSSQVSLPADDVARLFIERGAQIPETILTDPRSKQIVLEWLNEGIKTLTSYEQGKTVENRDLTFIKQLLNARDAKGRNLLRLAVREGLVESVNLILDAVKKLPKEEDRKAILDAVDSEQQAPALVSALAKRAEVYSIIAKALIDAGAETKQLIISRLNDERVVKGLLELKAVDPNEVIENKPILHHAIEYWQQFPQNRADYVQSIQYLIQYGADVSKIDLTQLDPELQKVIISALDLQKQTPEARSQLVTQIGLLPLLLTVVKAGKPLDLRAILLVVDSRNLQQSIEGKVPFTESITAAVERGEIQIVNELLEKTRNNKLFDGDRAMALIKASDKTDIAKSLLDFIVDKKVLTEQGVLQQLIINLALYPAKGDDLMKLINLILTQNIAINQWDTIGRLSLNIAIANPIQPEVKLQLIAQLIEKGADPNVKSRVKKIGKEGKRELVPDKSALELVQEKIDQANKKKEAAPEKSRQQLETELSNLKNIQKTLQAAEKKK